MGFQVTTQGLSPNVNPLLFLYLLILALLPNSCVKASDEAIRTGALLLHLLSSN